MSSNQPSARQQYSADLLQRLRELALMNPAMGEEARPLPSSPAPGPSKQQAKKGSIGGGSPSSSGGSGTEKKKLTTTDPTTLPSNQGTTLANNDNGDGTAATDDANKDDAFMRQLEALKKLLECPVCLQMQGTPLYLCTQGHSVCHNCRQKLLKCPMCQHPILNTRNLLAEQIIGTLDFKCPYAGEGCQEKVLQVDKKKHLLVCYYRPVECNFTGLSHNCKKSMVKYSNYVRHLKTVHNMKGIMGTIMNVSQYVAPESSKLSTDIPWHEWPVQYMDACNQTFITGSTILDGTIFWWLYVFGDRETADKYKCKITLQNKAKGLELCWTGPVFPIRCRPLVIKKTGQCLMANKDTIKAVSYTRTVDNTEKVAWDLVFSVSKRPAPGLIPASSTPNGLDRVY